MGERGSVAQLRARCAEVGFDLDRAKGSLLERMRLLADHSHAFDDALRLAEYAERVFRHYERTNPSRAFDPLERRIVVLASFFSDVGKTGPADADADARRLVVEAFAVENVRDDKQPVASFFRQYFPADADARIVRFAALGLDPGMSLREFWNLHSGWTLAIAEAAGVPPEAVAAAATHHLLDDVNPERIVGADDSFTRDFGPNRAFDRAEKLVILLDKYDAVRRRGKRTHDEAIAWLRERISRHLRFHDDAEFHELVGALDAALSS